MDGSAEDARGVGRYRDEPDERRPLPADLVWLACLAVGIGGIWLAVLLISLFAPDMVSGSQQEHLPLPAFTSWLWGGIGSLGFLWGMGRLRGGMRWRPVWIGLTVAILVIWSVATILAITLPEFVTGTDPTRIPFGALFAPMVASILTAFGGAGASVLRSGAWSRPPEEH